MFRDAVGAGHELDLGVPVGLAVFDDLIRALSEALDVRQVLPRVSAIVNHLLPHDRMLITFESAAGADLHGASNDDGPVFEWVRRRDHHSVEAGNYRIVTDMTRDPIGIIDPPDLQARLIAAGYRSVLSVLMSARDQ